MAEQRKFTSLEEMRAALGGETQVTNCKNCGKALKDPKFTLCWDCNQQQMQQRGGGAPPQSAPRQEFRRDAPAGNAPRLPANYLKDGYFDGENLREELINVQPLQIAEAFAAMRLTTGQLRRFYAHARFASQQLEGGADFAAVRPAILEMVAHAAGTVGRANGNGNLNYELFLDFIKANVEWAAKDRKSFMEGFVPHFQCIVAYFTYLKPKG